MRHFVLIFAVVVPLVMTAACGQKGALYLPPRNGTIVTRPAGTSPPPSNTTTPEDKKDNKENSPPPK